MEGTEDEPILFFLKAHRSMIFNIALLFLGCVMQMTDKEIL